VACQRVSSWPKSGVSAEFGISHDRDDRGGFADALFRDTGFVLA
jgi:hypothetical protein